MRNRIWLAATAACIAAVGITAPAHADRNVQNSHRPTLYPPSIRGKAATRPARMTLAELTPGCRSG